jgi:hypothetical protein
MRKGDKLNANDDENVMGKELVGEQGSNLATKRREWMQMQVESDTTARGKDLGRVAEANWDGKADIVLTKSKGKLLQRMGYSAPALPGRRLAPEEACFLMDTGDLCVTSPEGEKMGPGRGAELVLRAGAELHQVQTLGSLIQRGFKVARRGDVWTGHTPVPADDPLSLALTNGFFDCWPVHGEETYVKGTPPAFCVFSRETARPPPGLPEITRLLRLASGRPLKMAIVDTDRVSFVDLGLVDDTPVSSLPRRAKRKRGPDLKSQEAQKRQKK